MVTPRLALAAVLLAAACNQDLTSDTPTPRRGADMASGDDTPSGPESARCLAQPARQGLRTLQDIELGTNAFLNDLAVAQDGNVLILLNYVPESTALGELRSDYGAVVAKLARKDGAVLWRRHLDRATHDFPNTLARTPDGGVLVVSSGIGTGHQVLTKLRESDGGVSGTVELPLGTAQIHSLAVSRSGEVALGGGGSSISARIPGQANTSRGFFVFLTKLSSSYATQWIITGESQNGGGPANAVWARFHPDGDLRFGSVNASPYGTTSTAPDGFLGQSDPAGKLRWQQTLRYTPTNRYTPMNARIDVNPAGQVLFGADTVEGGDQTVGGRSFRLGGKLWVGMMEGQEVRWLRSTCSGDSALNKLRATVAGGAVVGGAFEGRLDPGGGPPLGSDAQGNVFVTVYGAGGTVLAATRIQDAFVALRGVNGGFELADRGVSVAPDANDEVLVGVSAYTQGQRLGQQAVRLLRLVPDGMPVGP